MIGKDELFDWLCSLPDDSCVGVDDGGLTLLCDLDADAWYKIGGMLAPDGESPGE
jgi:hypothetical protein